MFNHGKVQCQMCESKDGEILCEGCKRVFIYCNNCFKASHQSDNLSAHKNKPISKDSLECLIKEGYLCKNHNEERNTLICKTCSEAICSECAIKGKHRAHKVVPANDYFKSLLEAKSKKMDSVDLPYEDIARCVAAVEEVYGRRKNFVRKTTETVELLFKGVMIDISKHRQSILRSFENLEEYCVRKRNEIITVISNFMDKDDPIMKKTEDLKNELGDLVKIWRDKFAEVQNELVTLENAAISSRIVNLASIIKGIDFTEIRLRYSEIKTKCMSFKHKIEKRPYNACFLNQVAQRFRENQSQNIQKFIWNTASSVVFSDCATWHCYMVPKKLPTSFTAKIRINNITSAAGDWTHALGITNDCVIKQRIHPSDYAVLFNTTHWAFTPNFESARHEFKNEDIITITVNRAKEMHVRVNHERNTIPFLNMKGDLYLFCSLYGKQQEMELLSISELL